MSKNHVYIVRWWRENPADKKADWRFTLKSPTGNEQQDFFTDIDDLLTAVRHTFETTNEERPTRQ